MKRFAKKATLLGISATYFKSQINRKDDTILLPTLRNREFRETW